MLDPHGPEYFLSDMVSDDLEGAALEFQSHWDEF